MKITAGPAKVIRARAAKLAIRLMSMPMGAVALKQIAGASVRLNPCSAAAAAPLCDPSSRLNASP